MFILTSDNTLEENKISEAFTKGAIENRFPCICILTIDLFNSYMQTMRKEEAITKTEALRQSKLKRFLAKDMAEILDDEPSVDPNQLQALIDDRFKVYVNPTSILKKKDKNNQKTSKKCKAAATNI